MDYSRYKYIKIEVADHLATVTLNRPEARNAINHDFYEELLTIFVDLAIDNEVWAVLLTAAGDYFCVGGDVKGMSERPGGDVAAEGQQVLEPSHGRRMVHNILDCDKPIVSAINGSAVGLGANIALLCDIVVIAEDAKIGDTHTKIGLVAGDGAAAFWPLLIGPNRAKEFLMLSTVMTGKLAAEVGLVNYAVPRDQVFDKAYGFARKLADGPTWAMRWTKSSINKMLKQQVNLILDTSFALEMTTFLTNDHKEAVTAFIEKREPKFTGT